MDLENQLLETLVQTYIKRGIPIAKALDNPLFERMPLASKIAVLEKYKDQSKVPEVSKKELAKNMLWGGANGAFALGGLGGLISVAADGAGVVQANVVPKLLLAAGAGAALGTVLPALAMRNNYKRDMESHDLISKNKYLEALAARSMGHSQPVPKAFDLSSLVSGAQSAAYSAINKMQFNHPSNEDQ
jgi:hypothetical protein